MDLLLSLLFGVAIGVAVGALYLVYLGYKLKHQAEEAEDQLREFATTIIDKLVFLRVEELHEGMFAYDAVTGDFVCQGKDFDELNLNFGKRYPNKKGVMVKPDEGEAHDLHSVQSAKP